jgi:transglutaminase-like putative cysteine protease
VDLDHHTAQPTQLGEVAVANLPGSVRPYIYPSRDRQSDRLHRLAVKEFGHLWQGYGRVQAIRDWVRNRVTFLSNSSTGSTSAVDTLVDQIGVCRDFAHLMISLCRAVNIPEGFSHFVASMDAPVASGWSIRRVGFAPTGKRRLTTAHTWCGPRSACTCTPAVGQLLPYASFGNQSFRWLL